MFKLVENLPDLPFYAIKVPAGFPSPADDHLEEPIDLNALLIKRKSSTFVIQVYGDSMTGVGLMDGDYIVVDKSISPIDGHIVVAILNGDMTVKRLKKSGSTYVLKAENPKFKPIVLSEDNPPDIWGVVTGVLRSCV